VPEMAWGFKSPSSHHNFTKTLVVQDTELPEDLRESLLPFNFVSVTLKLSIFPQLRVKPSFMGWSITF
jgi:hypothetical protein